MLNGIRLGRIFGIPVRLTFSFLLLCLLALLSWHSLQGLILLASVFSMVLMHELGHALVARRLRVPIIGIDLHFFGGAAKMAHPPRTARDEILIAAAGPAVSFALALVFFGLFAVLGKAILLHLSIINLILGGFNLLPALPMDGGRIFRAALTRRLGRLRATVIAVKVARVVAVLIGVWGLLGIWPLTHSSFFLVGLALLLWWMAGAELQVAAFWNTVRGSGFGDFVGPGFAGAGADSPQQGPEVEVLDRDGQPVSRGAPSEPVVDHARTMAMPPGGQWGRFTVEEVSRGSARSWVVRGPNGEVLFRTENPYQ